MIAVDCLEHIVILAEHFHEVALPMGEQNLVALHFAALSPLLGSVKPSRFSRNSL